MNMAKSHILICNGSSCKKKSKKFKKVIDKFTKKKQLEDCIFHKESKCLKQCKKAPVVLISQPKEWLLNQNKKKLKKNLKKKFC